MADDGAQSPQTYARGVLVGGGITSPIFVPPAPGRRTGPRLCRYSSL